MTGDGLPTVVALVYLDGSIRLRGKPPSVVGRWLLGMVELGTVVQDADANRAALTHPDAVAPILIRTLFELAQTTWRTTDIRAIDLLVQGRGWKQWQIEPGVVE